MKVARPLDELQPNDGIHQIALDGFEEMPHGAHIVIAQRSRGIADAPLCFVDAVERLAKHHRQALKERFRSACMLSVSVGVLHGS